MFSNMKKGFFVTMYALLLVLNSCDCQSSCSPKTTQTNQATCGKCGKTSCSRECGGEETQKLMPSCSLDAKAQIERGSEVKKMLNQAKAVHEITNGYDFVFVHSTKMVTDLTEMAAFERKCCASFTWEVVEEPQEKLVHLKVFGSKDIKPEIKSGFEQIGLTHLFK
jgi:hypothetical protein